MITEAFSVGKPPRFSPPRRMWEDADPVFETQAAQWVGRMEDIWDGVFNRYDKIVKGREFLLQQIVLLEKQAEMVIDPFGQSVSPAEQARRERSKSQLLKQKRRMEENLVGLERLFTDWTSALAHMARTYTQYQERYGGGKRVHFPESITSHPRF